ncbi:CHAD domain-containing protein [bacterium]|nr:CHAD domain-containing protein [bacterium]
MPGIIAIPVLEANILRSRLRNLMSLREEFLNNSQDETIHDFRVASRRAREVLDYLEPILPKKVHERLMDLARRVTKNLGTARESEVNLEILNRWGDERKLDPIAVELLIHSQKMKFNAGSRKAKKRISSRKFEYIPKFLANLRGSRTMQATDSGILQKRQQDFLGFPWDIILDDERLHDLRIRTKKFRYSVEINNRVHKKRLGRFIRKIRNLQDVLGKIHDLYVLTEITARMIEEWDDDSLKIIPSALRFSYDKITAEKHALYSLVYPRYSRILESSPLVAYQHSEAAAAV